MKFGKKNHVSTDIWNYSHMMLGQSKIGKSSTVKKILEKTVDPDEGYLFLEIQDERGADAIEGINYINTTDWYNDYDEINNSIGFGTIIDDIVKNKVTDYPKLRVVVFDTLDQLITISEKHAIDEYNRQLVREGKPEKQVKTINASWGGFGAGGKKATEYMLDSIEKLKSVGVQTFIIGHVKNKDVVDPITNQTYTILSADSQQNYFNAIKKNVHILSMAYVDRDIVKEKTGRKDITGKDISVDRVASESRKIKFRDDSYVTDTGSRFADITPEIPLDADAYIKAVQDAIKAEIAKGNRTLEDAEKETAAIDKAMEEKVIKDKSNVNTKSALKEMLSLIAQNKNNKEMVNAVMAKAKELGLQNPAKATTIEQIDTLTDTVKSSL